MKPERRGREADAFRSCELPARRSGYARRIGGLILLTGATGYVGGRVLAVLEERGARVRCLSRRPDPLRPNVLATTEVVPGDVLRPDTVAAALEDVETLDADTADRNALWPFHGLIFGGMLRNLARAIPSVPQRP